MSGIGARKALAPQELARVGDRLSFVYLERCTIHREDNAITAEDVEGIRYIPAATIGTLLLGPGTRVTHQAMRVLGECGAGVVWTGEHGVRYYAGGRALSRSSALAEAQARAWANTRSRVNVARAMHRLRFPDADTSKATRRRLLGMEGDRVKTCYRQESARTGAPWHGRHFIPGDFNSGDPPNQGVTAAAQCLYGVAHTVVAALGCSPALGFIHSGHELSFVLDVADFYKTDVGIPAAFDAAAEGPEDVGSRTRRLVRDRINQGELLDRCVRDIKTLLLPKGEDAELEDAADSVALQVDGDMQVESGINYGVIW
ncbi:type I-E CRISPR-associated endonuclease Cas1e [Marinactinospora rubrisoli]|uniref:CRISPR-associated endonuclease Cas1 n=1 Tax=Marinactinospora rubrisoli TaxID=2715399 RepID=A0ABW2KBH3_9ACTN